MNNMTQMESFTIRLPVTAINKLNEFARERYLPPRTLIRTWIMQRLEAERSNIEPVPGADIGVTTPGTDGHQTQGAGAGANID